MDKGGIVTDHSDLKVSVIVPAYNAAPSILGTLYSLEYQSHPLHEVIVVDDGSKDGTADIVSQFQSESHINVRLISQKNQGVCAARNHGVQEATGDYISFLDSDDLYHVDKIKEQIAILVASNSNWAPANGVVLCAIKRFSIEGDSVQFGHQTTPHFKRADSEDERLSKVLNMKNNEMAMGSCFLTTRSAFLAAGGFDEQIHIAEDWDLLIRLARLNPVLSAEKSMYFYWKHPGSVTSNYANYRALQQFQEQRIRAHGYAIAKAEKSGKTLLVDHWVDFFNISHSGRHYLMAIEMLLKICINRPSEMTRRRFWGLALKFFGY